MKTLILICLLCGILNAYAGETNKPNKLETTKQIADDTTTNTAAAAAVAKELTNDATKDKRQTKDTKDAAATVYANHRSDSISGGGGNSRSNTNSDDPEDPQETIYGTNARQFLIRPQQQTQHTQQNDEDQHQQHQQLQHQQQRQLQHATQLRNYPVTIRPHSTQLLEQSQEIQHYAYLQDLNRHHQQKVQQIQGKSQSPQSKKPAARSQSESANNQQVDEAEQRYAVAVEQLIPQQQPHHHQPRAYIHRPPYQFAVQQQQQQQQQPQGEQPGQPQQSYQIIPEEQFLKILEEELQARAYHEDQVRRQEVAHAQAQAAQHPKALSQQPQGLGHYRQRVETEEAPQQQQQPDYVQYVQRTRAGPKYLPLPQNVAHEQQQLAEQEAAAGPHSQPQLPPQIAYYQPQISYKTLPNHPLAKSSLEKEIEKLLATNKPHVAPVQIVDNSNEPSVLINHHQHASQAPPPLPTQQSHHSPRSHISPKAYIQSTAAPNSLVDANNQAFVPSLFRFSNYPQATANYPQHVIDAKKLGPVVYPPQSQSSPSAQPPVQASQFYYQEAIPSPSPRPKAFRSKYGTKFATTPTPLKTHQNEVNYPSSGKYGQPLLYEIERPTTAAAPGPPAAAPTHFYPSPPDPHRNIPSPPPPPAPPTPSASTKYSLPAPNDYRQYALPHPSSSQSSIYVSQGTGISTPSRPRGTVKPKTVEDLKQLHLPQPGGKPLTQEEFQALVDAGYPVTAVPVPVPVPYDQYIKDHPEYRNQPPPQPPALPVNYEQLMRFAQLQQHQAPHQFAQQHRLQNHHHPRSLIARPSEPSVKIISSPSEPQPQTATGIGGGSVTYLRAIPENSKRRPRDESETKVLGAKEVGNEEERTSAVEEKQVEKRETKEK